MQKGKTAYMCAIDYDFHLEEDTSPRQVYTSLERLKEDRKCIDECGWVKVMIVDVERGEPTVGLKGSPIITFKNKG